MRATILVLLLLLLVAMHSFRRGRWLGTGQSQRRTDRAWLTRLGSVDGNRHGTATHSSISISIGIVLAYHYVKRDWLATQKQIANDKYEAMQKRIHDLVQSGGPEDMETAKRLTAERAEYYATA